MKNLWKEFLVSDLKDNSGETPEFFLNNFSEKSLDLDVISLLLLRFALTSNNTVIVKKKYYLNFHRIEINSITFKIDF